MFGIPGEPDIDGPKGRLAGQLDLFQPDGFARSNLKAIKPAPLALKQNIGVAGHSQAISPAWLPAVEPAEQLDVAKFTIAQDNDIGCWG